MNSRGAVRAMFGRGGAMAVVAVAGTTVLGCGGGAANGSASSAASAATGVDGDALAILPSKPVAVVHLDVKAMFASQSVGASLTTLAQRANPYSDASGFVASRDLDEVTAGVYLLEGVDVAAVLRGRFDVQKINAAAEAQVASGGAQSGGNLVVRSTYAGQTLYTVNNAGFCTLTGKTMLGGTETGIRRMLDKIRDQKLGRDLDQTMADTLVTPGAALAAAGNFHTSPVPNVIPIPWIRSLDSARVLANFKDPGLNIAGRLSYADANGAQAGSDGLNQAATMANAASIFGLVPRIQNLDVKIVQNDVTFTFGVDDGQLRSLLQRLVAMIPASSSAPASTTNTTTTTTAPTNN